MKLKIISIFIICFILLSTYSYGIYSVIPIWEDMSDTTEVNADTADNFLNIESESAILILMNSLGQLALQKL